MLNKQIISIDTEAPNEHFIVNIESKQQLNNLKTITSKYQNNKYFLGISINSNLLDQALTDQETKEKAITETNIFKNIKYFSISLTDISHINELQKIQIIKSKDIFTELIIPINIFNTNILKNLTGINRIILDFTNNTNFQENIGAEMDIDINNIFAELISYNYFPFTKGLQNNTINNKHKIEYYNNKLELKI